ncbi:MAG TPA: UPF0158 family protein [Longimicrobium sp.]|nr:UPF0158 family protein [Longimicrobium sp.]
MAKIQIDQGLLEMAFDSGDGMMSFYLDRETGDVIPLGDDNVLAEEEEVRQAIEEGDERYLPIPSRSSHEGFRVMEDFVYSLEPGPARTALADALNRHRPFRSFKDALFGFPDVRQAWFAYEQQRLSEEAMDWLRSEGIDAELVPYVDRWAEGGPRE